MVSPEESRLNETQWQQHHCCFPHGSLKLMNLAVDHIFSAVNAFLFFLYMLGVRQLEVHCSC